LADFHKSHGDDAIKPEYLREQKAKIERLEQIDKLHELLDIKYPEKEGRTLLKGVAVFSEDEINFYKQ